MSKGEKEATWNGLSIQEITSLMSPSLHNSDRWKGADAHMLPMLEQAFVEASKLPAEDQESLGRWLLAEVISERRWEKAFADSQDVLARLAEEALEEHHLV